MGMPKLCSIPDCAKPVVSWGWCVMHYTRWQRHGDPLITYRPRRTPMECVLAESKRMPSGCREWQRATNANGYGRIGVQNPGGSRLAHVVAYEAVRGPVPPGLILDHLICDNPLCNDEWHVEPSTHAANVARGNSPGAISRRTNRCNNGHELTPENTYVRPLTGHRRCRICMRAQDRKRVPRRAAERRARKRRDAPT